METKINRLLQNTPQGIVLLSAWLLKLGYSRELQHRYIKSGWLTSIGHGALMRKGDEVSLYGAVYSIQNQLNKSIHIGGRSALGLHGLAHYLELNPHESVLFAPKGTKIPLWFYTNNWDTKPVLVATSLLPNNVGLVDFSIKSFSIKISSPARAFLECLYLTPKYFDIQEAWHIMENLTTLRPDQVQALLEQCKSVKVLRLFLFLAEKANHQWFKYLNINKINLGSGKRSIYQGGVYESKYRITIPQSLL